MPLRRVLKSNDVTIERTFYDGETATNATGAVAVTVTREDGTALTGGNATQDGATGRYIFALDDTTHLSQLDRLAIGWTATVSAKQQKFTDYVEVLGAHLVEISEIRGLKNLSDTTKFTLAELEQAREWFYDLLSRLIPQVAFVPSYDRYVFDGHGGIEVLLPKMFPRSLIKVTISGETKTTTDWKLDEHGLVRVAQATTFKVPTTTEVGRNCSIAYEHGLDSPPEDLREAALVAIRERLLNDQAGRPMLSVADGAGGTTRFAVASEDRPTGNPDVDAVLISHRDRYGEVL